MHDGCVTDSTESEAGRLWLARIAAAPDQWRLRGTNAAGLLSGAAAATLIALFTRSAQLHAGADLAGVVAGAMYALAVLTYLLASVWRGKKVAEGQARCDAGGQALR